MGSIWTALPRPRPLSAAERAVLMALVAHVCDRALTAQAAAAVVTGTCTGGCRSLRLHSDAPGLSPTWRSSDGGAGADSPAAPRRNHLSPGAARARCLSQGPCLLRHPVRR